MSVAFRPIVAPTDGSTHYVSFSFGFATSEGGGPGEVFDAFSIGMMNSDRTAVATFLTVDANGVSYAPQGEGTLPVGLPRNFVQIHWDPPAGMPTYAAYQIDVPIPGELLAAGQAQPLNFYASMFNNQNGLESHGWVMAVPEPSSIGLFVAGAVSLVVLRSRRNSGRDS